MDRVALITGASKGIGKELARVFAKHGYSLILIARTTSELENLQKTLQSEFQCEVKILSVDLTKPECIDIIMETFKDDMTRIEVLINNAGYGITKKFTDMAYQDVGGIITLNMDVLTKLTYRILPFMVAKKSGKILNVASTAAFAPGPYMAQYYASKAYVLSLSEALFEEYKEDGVTVSALCPGVTPTSFQARAGMENTRIMSGMVPAMTAQKVAEIAYQGLMKNKRVIVTGLFNKIAVFLMWITPTYLNLKITAMLDKPR